MGMFPVRVLLLLVAVVLLGSGPPTKAQLSEKAATALDEARMEMLRDAGLGHLSKEDGLKVAALIGKTAVGYEQRARASRTADLFVRDQGYEPVWVVRTRYQGSDVLVVGRSSEPRVYTTLSVLELGLPRWEDGLHYGKKDSFRGLKELINDDGRIYKFSVVAEWKDYR
jgi:hypothetical protein